VIGPARNVSCGAFSVRTVVSLPWTSRASNTAVVISCKGLLDGRVVGERGTTDR
jgi:hypothetical protein